MAKRIITISREFGSGGRFIGEEVAKKLGMAYYDKNVITEIAEKSRSYLRKKACLPMRLPGVTLRENRWKISYMRRRER